MDDFLCSDIAVRVALDTLDEVDKDSPFLELPTLRYIPGTASYLCSPRPVFEVKRAAVNSSNDVFITSTVPGWRGETYLLKGSDTQHFDIISASCIGKASARLVVGHPLKFPIAISNSDHLLALRAELGKIQWAYLQQSFLQPEHALRAKSIAALTEYIDRREGLGLANVPTKLKALDASQGRHIPWQLLYNRPWRVISGPRAGVMLCEACELPDEQCGCPRVVDKVGHNIFREVYWAAGSSEPSVHTWRVSDHEGPSKLERQSYVAWREWNEREHEVIMTRRWFGKQYYDMAQRDGLDRRRERAETHEYQKYRAHLAAAGIENYPPQE